MSAPCWHCRGACRPRPRPRQHMTLPLLMPLTSQHRRQDGDSSGHWEEWGGGQVWLDPGTQTTGSGYPPTPFCFCAGFFSPADRPPSRKKSRHLSHSSRVGPAHWVEPQRPCLDSGPPPEPGLALTRRVRLTDPAEDTASSGEDTAAPNPFHASHQPRVQGRHLRCSARHTVVLT